MKMTQNDIEKILNANPLIPVATIHNLSQVDEYYEVLNKNGIKCIEITLRNDIAWDAVKLFKEKYGSNFNVGVGTIVSSDDILKCASLKVDFMVSPGFNDSMIQEFNSSGIPFLPGVSTPSEIIRGINLGWEFFKFFPANLFGGEKALKTYGGIFKNVKFCPTGGINESNYQDHLELDNVISVGGSWLLNK